MHEAMSSRRRAGVEPLAAMEAVSDGNTFISSGRDGDIQRGMVYQESCEKVMCISSVRPASPPHGALEPY